MFTCIGRKYELDRVQTVDYFTILHNESNIGIYGHVHHYSESRVESHQSFIYVGIKYEIYRVCTLFYYIIYEKNIGIFLHFQNILGIIIKQKKLSIKYYYCLHPTIIIFPFLIIMII